MKRMMTKKSKTELIYIARSLVRAAKQQEDQMPYFTLKWTPEDPSNSLIQTYRSVWERQILNDEFSFEFRKTGPNNMTPDRVYVYLTRPVQAIVARLPVKDCGYITLEKALSVSKQSLLSIDELRVYAAGRAELYFYQFGKIDVAKHPITNAMLAADYGYFPSANFFPLSGEGRDTLDRLGKF
jgi:predicted transcriptional regulator